MGVNCNPGEKEKTGNSSAQDFALAAKSVRKCKLSKKNLPLAESDLEWADSVTGSRKAELLQKQE